MSVHEMDFCTLGMFIIDDIYPSPSARDQTAHLGITGGAGTYSAIGARLLSPGPLSRRVGWIVDCGTDFPHELNAVISSWDTGVLMRQRDGLTTKGWNGYGANDYRAFKYLSPKLRLTADDLSPALLVSKSFHLICAPLRCVEMVEGVLARRKALDPALTKPIFIWEPVPDLCTPAELQNTFNALKYVDVISPNHEELATMFSVRGSSSQGDVDRCTIEECSQRLHSSLDGTDHLLSVVVRSGKDGCFVATTSPEKRTAWLPAYHGPSPEKVVDPTGGGNGFLGGFAVGFVRTGNVTKAAAWGAISASLCIEQVGVPSLGHNGQEEETWNGTVVNDRLAEYERLCGLLD